MKYGVRAFMERREEDKGELVVYLHRRATTGEPFYVGMGNTDRPSDVHGRNDYWKKIYNKHGRTIELLVGNGSEEFVKKTEIWLIAIYRGLVGRKRMANVSDGGEGSYGLSGEKSGTFQGYVRLYNDEQKVQLILGGKKEMRENGFDDTSIYAVKNGRLNSTGSKFYADSSGYRIQFKVEGPFETREDALVDGFKIAEKNADNAKANQIGVLNGQFSGFRFGINDKTKKIVLSIGNKNTIAQGFDRGHVDSNIRGECPHHKGFVFTRISTPEEVFEIAHHYLEQNYDFHHPLTEENFLSLM